MSALQETYNGAYNEGVQSVVAKIDARIAMYTRTIERNKAALAVSLTAGDAAYHAASIARYAAQQEALERVRLEIR